MLAQKKSGTFLSPLLFAFAFNLKRSAPQVKRSFPLCPLPSALSLLSSAFCSFP